jgi:hypothetical protein
MKFDDDMFNIFDDDDNFENASSLGGVMKHLTEGMEADKIKVTDAIEALLNIIKPGSTDMSHDIRHHLIVAMIAQHFEVEARRILGAFLTQFPWGFGLHIMIHDRENEFSPEAQRALIASIHACLVAGGIKATLTDTGIHIDSEQGSVYSVDQQVEQFREELDARLGPDADQTYDNDAMKEVSEWMKRWMG